MDGEKACISELKEFHTNNRVHFWIRFMEEKLIKDEDKFKTNMKLKSKI